MSYPRRSTIINTNHRPSLICPPRSVCVMRNVSKSWRRKLRNTKRRWNPFVRTHFSTPIIRHRSHNNNNNPPAKLIVITEHPANRDKMEFSIRIAPPKNLPTLTPCPSLTVSRRRAAAAIIFIVEKILRKCLIWGVLPRNLKPCLLLTPNIYIRRSIKRQIVIDLFQNLYTINVNCFWSEKLYIVFEGKGAGVFHKRKSALGVFFTFWYSVSFLLVPLYLSVFLSNNCFSLSLSPNSLLIMYNF